MLVPISRSKRLFLSSRDFWSEEFLVCSDYMILLSYCLLALRLRIYLLSSLISDSYLLTRFSVSALSTDADFCWLAILLFKSLTDFSLRLTLVSIISS